MSNTNNDVAHAWAHQTKPRMRSSNGTMSFDDALLYSYSTVIACRISPDFALFSDRSYRATTRSKHMSPAMRAFPGAYVRVPEVARNPNHDENIRVLEYKIAGYQAKARRAKQPNMIAHWANELQRAIRDANAYLDAFSLDHPRFTVDTDFAAKMAEYRAAAEAAAKEREEKAAALETEQREAWLAGAMVTAPRHGGVFLRVDPRDADTLETSWGVRVPLAQAIRIFERATMARRDKATFTPPSRVAIGDFQLTHIEADGTIIAGCHRIEFSEAERLAKKIGILVDA